MKLAASRHVADRRLYSILKRTRRILERRYLSGTGIPDEKIPHVYRRLFRIENLWSLGLWPYTVVFYSVGEERILIVDML
jgi:hypothetical protein